MGNSEVGHLTLGAGAAVPQTLTLIDDAVASGALARNQDAAETEKYAHVTYFFNGGRETPCEGECRALVPSQRDVATYDLKPQMSATQITDAFLDAFANESPRFSIINFANADMVGHTGVIPAAVIGVETIDRCLERVVSAVHGAGGACVITADHGNAEHMEEMTGRSLLEPARATV